MQETMVVTFHPMFGKRTLRVKRFTATQVILLDHLGNERPYRLSDGYLCGSNSPKADHIRMSDLAKLSPL
jgi:hypothetical protein